MKKTYKIEVDCANCALKMEETAKLAMATSAGAVATIGTKPPSRAYVEELLEQAQLIKVEE